MPSQHYIYSSIQRGQCLPFSATVNKDDMNIGVKILIKTKPLIPLGIIYLYVEFRDHIIIQSLIICWVYINFASSATVY